jgi:flagellar hook-length control protein FliK
LQGDFGLSVGTGAQASGKTDDTDQSLLSLLGKKDESLSWNPLFPNAVQGTALQNQNVSMNIDGGLTLNRTEETVGKEVTGSDKPEMKQVTSLDTNYLALKAQGLQTGEKGVAEVQNQKDESQGSAVQKAQREIAVQAYSPAKTGSSQKVVVENQQVTAGAQQVHNPLVENQSKESKAELSSKKHGNEGDEVFLVTQNPQQHAQIQTAPVTANAGKGEVRHSIPEVMQKVESMIHHGGGKMTVMLNPPSLGRVEVEVTAKGKNVEIQMKSENSIAKTTLESHFADLKQSMQVQDLNLHKMEVHVNRDWDSSMQGGQQFAQFAGQQSSQHDARGSQDSKDTWNNPQSAKSAIAKVMPGQVSGRNVAKAGGVDIRI